MYKEVLKVAGLVGAVIVLAGCASSSGAGDPVPAEERQGVAALVPAEVREAGKIVAATEISAPFAFYKEGTSEIIGIDPELWLEVADRLELETEVIESPGDGGIPGLQGGRWDVLLGEGDFKDRHGIADFIDTTREGTTWVIAAGNPLGINSPDDLCGTRVAYAKGNIMETITKEQSEKCVADGKPAIEELAFSGSEEVYLALQSRRADAVSGIITTSTTFVNNYPEVGELMGEPQWLAPVAITLLKGQDEFRDAIVAALEEMLEDGTYAAILEKYGQSDVAVDTIEVNGTDF